MLRPSWIKAPEPAQLGGNPIYRALAGAILVPLTRVAHGPRPINGAFTVFDFSAVFFVFFCFFGFWFFFYFSGLSVRIFPNFF
jgi:hypothetical protein